MHVRDPKQETIRHEHALGRHQRQTYLIIAIIMTASRTLNDCAA
jgi:hypothetical protein